MAQGAVVLNTARCGSTMLSDLLADHPEVASVQEFFLGIVEAFPARPRRTRWSGAEFWDVLTRPNEVVRVLHRIGRLPEEYRYRTPADGAELRVPGLLGFTLPALSGDPDRLFAALAGAVPEFPERTPGEHCAALFDLLAELTGKSRWVERTGGSAGFAAPVLRLFPDTRVVYLNRDCVDTARSMSRMSYGVLLYLDLLLTEATGAGPYRGMPLAEADVPPELRPLLPANLTAATFDRYLGAPDLVRYSVGALAVLHQTTELALAAVPPGRLLRLSYEDLRSAPHDRLTELAEFLDLPDPAPWITRCAARIRPATAPPAADPQRTRLITLFDTIRTGPVLHRATTGTPDWLTRWLQELDPNPVR
jgi:putative sulfotransferase